MNVPIDTISVQEEAARLGEAMYAQRLRPHLEPHYNGQIVAIHLPSGDYFVGASVLEATDRLRQKYPDAVRGETYARSIGQRTLLRAHTPRVTESQS